MGTLFRIILTAAGVKTVIDIGGPVAKNAGATAFIKLLAGGLEITAGVLDVLGYILFIAFILGWKKGGQHVGVVWPLSIILEAVSYGLWNS